MMKERGIRIIKQLLIPASVFILCTFSICENPTDTDKTVTGYLNVSFNLFNMGDPTPSRLTAIWLEDSDGNYIRSFHVSEWLYKNYHNPSYCSTWHGKAVTSEGVIDAVSQATPAFGDNTIETLLDTFDLERGDYYYCIESHVVQNVNMLFKALVTLDNGSGSSYTPAGTYEPDETTYAGYANNEDVLKNVSMEYGDK